MNRSYMSAVSLFSSGGIGDLAVRASGFEILVSSEILKDRHAVFKHNFPTCESVTGDIRSSVSMIEQTVRTRIKQNHLTLLYATPPCQGMSRNGRGKLLSAIRQEQKPVLDERNHLIIPAMELAVRLKPEIILFENVPEMSNTVILDDEGKLVTILDFIKRKLGPDYVGCAEVVEFADYGISQCRQRLITIYSRHPNLVQWFSRNGTFLPPKTHGRNGENGTARWITVRDSISGLPPLDAKDASAATSDLPFHRVPMLDKKKYWWVSNTPMGQSAFNNQCDKCGFDKNPTHTAKHDEQGINRPSKNTPLFCQNCGCLLPRPSVLRHGKHELMRGFTSAYKRMSYDKPASTLTRNLSYACSDNKLHPEQNRVLSLYEAFRLHSLDRYDYDWTRSDRKTVSDKTIREIIGESIPPAGLQIITDHLIEIYQGIANQDYIEGQLFAFN